VEARDRLLCNVGTGLKIADASFEVVDRAGRATFKLLHRFYNGFPGFPRSHIATETRRNGLRAVLECVNCGFGRSKDIVGVRGANASLLVQPLEAAGAVLNFLIDTSQCREPAVDRRLEIAREMEGSEHSLDAAEDFVPATLAIDDARRVERRGEILLRDGIHSQHRAVVQSRADGLRLQLEDRERIVSGRNARQRGFGTVTAGRIKSRRHCFLHFRWTVSGRLTLSEMYPISNSPNSRRFTRFPE
jgi:hypothetical protein